MSCAESRIDPFREACPAFSDQAVWPDDVIEMALEEADAETGGRGWGSYKDCPKNFKRRGMFAYAAHWLASTYPSGAANQSAQSGAAKSAVASKSVGDESVSFAVAAPSGIAEGGQAWFLSTVWGQQFIRLRKRAGMGARAV